MRVAGIVRDSLVNGDGIRDAIFVQGCPHHCFNCQNPQTWNYEGGREIPVEDLAKLFKDSPNDVTISGGEPFQQWGEVVHLMYYIKQDNPSKRFWIYTGYRYEDIQECVERYMQPYLDVIVDGRYIEELKDPNCLYRGSSNQRLIDVQRTLKEGKIILWEDLHEART